MIKTAVIVAGGEGARLRPFTEDRPKVLVAIAGKPLLYWKLMWLKSYGIKHIVLGVAYKKEQVYEYMRANDNFGFKVDFSEHTVDGGTAEGMYLAVKRFVKDDDYLFMNGDDIITINLSKMIEKHMEKHALITMGLSPLYAKTGVVSIKGDVIVDYNYGKRMANEYVYNGVCVFNSKMKDYMAPKGSAEDIVFAKLAKTGKAAVPYIISDKEECWYSTNNLKELEEAEAAQEKWMGQVTR